MVTTPYQTTLRTQTSPKCRWDRKQKRKTEILHRPERPNRTKYHHTMILPVRPQGTQSNPRIPMVRGDPTKDRLEKGMDRPLPTPNSAQSSKRAKSNLRPKNTKHTTTNPQRKILLMQSHDTSRTTRGCRLNQGTKGILQTRESIQQTTIPMATKKNGVGPHNWAATERPEITSRKTTKTSTRRNQGNR